MGLDGASFIVVEIDLPWNHTQLLGQMHNHDGGNVLLLRRKAPLRLKILQQAGRAEQIVIGLAVADQIEFFGRECPMFDQLFVLLLSLHGNFTSYCI